jgi:hypothetical protein
LQRAADLPVPIEFVPNWWKRTPGMSRSNLTEKLIELLVHNWRGYSI